MPAPKIAQVGCCFGLPISIVNSRTGAKKLAAMGDGCPEEIEFSKSKPGQINLRGAASGCPLTVIATRLSGPVCPEIAEQQGGIAAFKGAGQAESLGLAPIGGLAWPAEFVGVFHHWKIGKTHPPTPLNS